MRHSGTHEEHEEATLLTGGSGAWEATVKRDILIGTRVGEYVVRRPADAATVRREVKELAQRLGAMTKIGKKPEPVARNLDSFEQQFEKSGDLKPR